MNKFFEPKPVIVSSTEEGNILEVSKSFTDICGFSSEEVVAKKVKDIKLWKNPTHREKLVERVKHGEEVINENVIIRTKSGEELEVSISMVAIKSAGIPIVLSIGHTLSSIRKRQPAALCKTKVSVAALVCAGNDKSKIALPMGDGLIFIRISDIVYFKASGNYTEIYLINGKKHLVSRVLQEFESLLADHNFFRIHHSTLVQLDLIERYVKSEGGYLIMADNSQLGISRRKREAFLARIGYKERSEP